MTQRSKKTYIDKDGYKRFTNTGIKVHLYVAERKLRRKLRKGEVVHHINRDKTDNRRKNLWVFRSQNDHYSTHKRDKKKYGRW